MNTTGIRPGDIVRCEKKNGVSFYAFVGERTGDGEIVVEPMVPNISYRTVTAREIKAHWRKAGRR